MEFDDILTRYIGDFGLYQLLFYFGVTSISIHLATSLLDYAFIGATPTFWCHVPELNTHNFSQSEIEEFVSPPASKTGCDPCFMYVRNYSKVTEDDIEEFLYMNNSAVELDTTQCTTWNYDQSIYSSTIVTEWDLVCVNTWLIAVSQSIFMAGQFSVVVSGFLADKYGRRTVALVSLLVHIVVRLITAFSVNYAMFIVGRLLTSIADIAWYTALYVFTVEIVGPKWRVLSGMSLYYFWLAGYVVLALLAYFIRGWRMLVLATTVLVLPYLAHFCFLPESPRWLAANGKTVEAKKVLDCMAKVNKRWMPDNVFIQNKKDDKNSGGSILDLFKSWYFMKITLIFFFQWNATTLVYYGLTFYLPNLGGSPSLSLLLSGLVEVPAVLYTQFAMDSRLGRKINIIICFCLSGGLLLLILVLPKHQNWLIITVAILGKWGVSANFGFLYMMSTEVYPTTLRNVGLSACSMMGRIGSVISPFISQLKVVHPYLPAIIMGVMSVIAGILGIFLPETRGQNMPDTVAEATKSRGNGTSANEEEMHLNEKPEIDTSI